MARRFGLTGVLDELPGALPLGQRQRLSLAAAMIHGPEMLILDEPTSGVDPLARRAFWDLIDELAAGGTTVLVSTHYMEEAEHCHRLIVMNRGRRIAEGSPAELRTAMDAPIYEIETDDAPRAVEVLQHVPGVAEAAMFGRTVHVVSEDAARPEDATRLEHAIPAALARSGLACTRVRRVEPSLEDVFVALVRRTGGAVEG